MDLTDLFLLLLVLFRCLSAFAKQYIDDCDESFNYWEPVHYLLYGVGFQTWEYSPIYALRSYLYVGFHALIGAFFKELLSPFFADEKIAVFYMIRFVLSAFCGLSETFFLKGVGRVFGERIQLYSTVFLLCSPGMWASSSALLPSSFAMCGVMLSFGFWFRDKPFQAVLAAAASVILPCWPFVIVVYVPMALQLIYANGPLKVVGWGLISLGLFLVPTILVDTYFYGKVVISIWNILKYNALSSGSELYGIEPISYYFLNMVLNFNLSFILALISLGTFPLWNSMRDIQKQKTKLLVPLSSMYIWFSVMCYLPHKEERFLYAIYPLFALAAALSAHIIFYFLSPTSRAKGEKPKQRNSRSKSETLVFVIKIMLVLSIVLFGASRIVSMQVNYSAPFHLYTQYSQNISVSPDVIANLKYDQEIKLCVGEEWYRFPSHFFLPKSNQHSLNFISSSFKGLLPGKYSPESQTNGISKWKMNDQNKEEKDRHVLESSCHFLVESGDLPKFENNCTACQWQLLSSYIFLDVDRSPQPFRGFFIPFLSSSKNTYTSYSIFKNKNLFHP